MSDIKVGILFEADGNLGSRVQKYGQNLTDLSKKGKTAGSVLGRSFLSGTRMASNGLDRLGNRYTALIASLGAGVAVRNVGNLEERIGRLGLQAGQSTEKMEKLKNQIYAVAQNKNIKVDSQKILDAVDAIVEKTGDLGFAEANLTNIGLAIQATGAEGKAVGELLAEAQKQDIKSPDAVLKFIDTLNEQGKSGAFTLQNLASLGPRVITAYTSMGRSGVGAMREMGAALQMIRQATGSSEMAATAFEATMRSLSDNQKIKKLQEMGIKVFDPAAAKEGKEVLRPINELMAEIVTKAGGKKTALGQIFEAEAMRAFNAMIAEYNSTGATDGIQKFMKVAGDGKTTINDSARAAKFFNSSVTQLSTSAQRFADAKLAGPISAFANAVDNISADKFQQTLDVLMNIGLAVGGIIIANKAIRTTSNLIGGVRKGMGALRGISKGGGAMSAAQATPVYVTNLGGKGGGLTAPGASEGNTPGEKNKFSKRLKTGAKVGVAGALVSGAVALPGIIDVLNDEAASAEDAGKVIGDTVGGIGGMVAGAAAGAAVGSIIPVIGTAIGGVIGGTIGAMGGNWLGSGVGGSAGGYVGKHIDNMKNVFDPQQQKVAGQINLHVTSEGRVLARKIEKEGDVDLAVSVGSMALGAP